MLHRKNQGAKGSRSRPERCSGMRLGLACLCMAVAAPLAGIAQSQNTAGDAQHTDKVTVPSPADQALSVTAPAVLLDKSAAQKNLSPAVTARQKQLTDDSTKLLALAVALKSEVDKTNQDMLSIGVIRKANEIEKLAHNVKDKLKQNAGKS